MFLGVGNLVVFMKNKFIYLICTFLLLSNVILLGLIYYKTNLIQRIGVRMGLIEQKLTDRSDYWCIQGWTNTLKKMDVDFDIVFFGNSITRGSSFHEYFSDVKICNLGYPGDNLDGMILRVDQIKAVKAEKVFLMAGINGLEIQTLDVFESKYDKLIKEIKKANPDIVLYLQSILPVNNDIAQNKYASNEKIMKANNIIERIAKNNGCEYINVFDLYIKDGMLDCSVTKDGVHLLPNAYDKWAHLLRPYIENDDIHCQLILE